MIEMKPGYTVEDLERLYKQCADTRTAQRLRAIYLHTLGKTPKEIAHALKRNPKTIRNWIRLFNAAGPEALRYKHSGGRTGKLTAEQEERLMRYLREGRPGSRRWTLKALAEKLFEDYGVRLSQQQLSKRVIRYGLRSALSKASPQRRKRGGGNS
jgi:transposase